jgi:hypothetical protein
MNVTNWKTGDPSKQAAYNEFTVAQMGELFQRYGPWTELWFDAGEQAFPSSCTSLTACHCVAGVHTDVNPLIGPYVRANAPVAVCHSCQNFTQVRMHLYILLKVEVWHAGAGPRRAWIWSEVDGQ